MQWAIAIHGGAGPISRTFDSTNHEESLKRVLNRAIEVLTTRKEDEAKTRVPNTSRALTAAIEAVVCMEDDPLFNAGRGSCLNQAAKCEMEAAVMDSSFTSGACCGLSTVKNPVLLANYIRTETPHCFIGFQAAEAIAEREGFAREAPEWFLEERRQKALEKLVGTRTIARDHDTEKVLLIPATLLH